MRISARSALGLADERRILDLDLKRPLVRNVWSLFSATDGVMPGPLWALRVLSTAPGCHVGNCDPVSGRDRRITWHLHAAFWRDRYFILVVIFADQTSQASLMLPG